MVRSKAEWTPATRYYVLLRGGRPQERDRSDGDWIGSDRLAQRIKISYLLTLVMAGTYKTRAGVCLRWAAPKWKGVPA